MSRHGNSNYPTSEGPPLELFESGLRAATATSSSSKIEYLANCVEKGLTKNESDAIRAQRITRIVSELDPEEMIVLFAHTKTSIADWQTFREQYPAIFDLPPLVVGSSRDARKRHAQYDVAEGHLIALGLLSEEIRFDHDTGAVKRFGLEIDKEVNITNVGRLVLLQAGLTNEI
jgi:hypothetical protein